VTTSSADVVVVGGGVVGTAIAAQLADAGQRVALAEASSPAAGASGAAPGRLNPPVKGPASGAVFDLHVAETARYPDHISRLRSCTGLDSEYRVPSLLLPRFDDESVIAQQELCAASRAAGVDAHWCDAAAAIGLEPHLNPEVRSAVWIPGAATVNARRLTVAQARAAELAGASICPYWPVQRLLRHGCRITGVSNGNDEIHAGATVVAAGVWSAAVLRTAGVDLEITPVRGQMIAVRPPAGWVTRMVVGEAGSLVPRVDGSVQIGWTSEHAGFDTRPTLEAIAREIAAAQHLVPGLGRFPFAGAWAGLRPVTPSGRPAIGQVAELDGLYAAVGHYADGVILGPSTGEVMRELIVADGVGRAALARYHAAGFLADPAEPHHGTSTDSRGIPNDQPEP
jgi:glycine oxidase